MASQVSQSAYWPGCPRQQWTGMCKSRLLLLYCMTIGVGWALPKAGPSLNVRLTTPLTSYDSAAGSEFEAVVIAPYMRQGRLLLPPGTTVFGTVTKTRPVG